MPTGPALRTADAFERFMEARRRLLADAMTALLNSFWPSWLVDDKAAPPDDLTGCTVELNWYGSVWDQPRMLVKATRDGNFWSAVIDGSDLMQVVSAAEDGLDSDLRVGGDERVPVHLEDDVMHVPIGPFTVSGTVEEWTEVIDRERRDPAALADLPHVTATAWEGEPKRFPVTSTD